MTTLLIIIITSIISIQAFSNPAQRERFIFHPPSIRSGGAYRLLSYGFIHADYTHLIFNMLTLYFFGSVIEQMLQVSFGSKTGTIIYILLYLSAISVSILPTYFKEKNNSYYLGLGASGAVSAVVFAYILISPMSFMGIMFIPVMLPAFLFGIIFVVLSIYLSRNHGGNINHTAHIAGGIYGILFLILIFAAFRQVNLLDHFIQSIRVDSWRDLVRVGY